MRFISNDADIDAAIKRVKQRGIGHAARDLDLIGRELCGKFLTRRRHDPVDFDPLTIEIASPDGKNIGRDIRSADHSHFDNGFGGRRIGRIHRQWRSGRQTEGGEKNGDSHKTARQNDVP